MRAGIITGSGTETWPGLDGPVTRTFATRYGQVVLTEGKAGGAEVLHLARHEAGHRRLPGHVNHRANLAALLDAGADCLISLTVCGAVDPGVPPGTVIVFDDLYFPGNRLPDASLCTWHDTPGAAGRGHWIFGLPFSEPVRAALIEAGRATGAPVLAGGCYGHVDGPRFNSRAEIAALARCGVTALSQTAGPEVVLAGEAGLPMALAGYVTDYANGVGEPEPVEALLARMRQSAGILAALVEQVLPRIGELGPVGVVHRFDP
ncbi:MAG TPA: MTAP family purine nucleoside phosphorylase [Streptosporangiaceae bacterium]